MVCEAVNTALGEFFTTLLASMLVAIGGIGYLRTAAEVLNNQGIWFSAHHDDLQGYG